MGAHEETHWSLGGFTIIKCVEFLKIWLSNHQIPSIAYFHV